MNDTPSQNCIGSRVRIPQFDSAQKTQTGVVTGSKPTLAFTITCYPPVHPNRMLETGCISARPRNAVLRRCIIHFMPPLHIRLPLITRSSCLGFIRSPIDSSVYGGFKSTFRGARSVSPRGANKERHHAARCRSGAAHRFAASPGSTDISVASCARPAGPCDCSCISQTSPAAQSDLGLISTARDCTR